MKHIPYGLLILLRTGVLAGFLSHCAGTSGGGPLPPATKEQPFVNSLGMKFVPVPGTNILMCTTETTLAQYQARGQGSRRVSEFQQAPNHPVVKVNWNDAKAWCAWLSKREGRKYRLPTDAEWSAAVGTGSYPWGNQWPPPHNSGNYADQTMRITTEAERGVFYKGFELIQGYNDGHSFTAPVGSDTANALGLHDLGGNVWEWCQDKHPTKAGSRVQRGSSWSNHRREWIVSSYRSDSPPDIYGIDTGFRCVVE